VQFLFALIRRRSNADQTAFNSVAENVVQQVCVTNDELTATKEQLAGQVRQLNEDRQSLRKQVSKLEEEVTKKQNELIQKQTIIDTLSHGSDELQKAMGKMMIDNGVLRQRVDDLQQLLGNAEAASEAAETRLADSKEVLKILGKDVRLSHMKLGSGSFGGKFS
jgi:chromosome segregation ATPase